MDNNIQEHTINCNNSRIRSCIFERKFLLSLKSTLNNTSFSPGSKRSWDSDIRLNTQIPGYNLNVRGRNDYYVEGGALIIRLLTKNRRCDNVKNIRDACLEFIKEHIDSLDRDLYNYFIENEGILGGDNNLYLLLEE